MQIFFVIGFKTINRMIYLSRKPFDQLLTFIILYSNGIKFSSFRSHGLPYINIGLGGKCVIGQNFKVNNRESSNPIGRFHPCSIIVGKKGNLIIGKNVGMSSTAIVCHEYIEIGDNVNIGGNVAIYDTDFHSLDYDKRSNKETDNLETKKAPIKISNNAFIGAHSTILKGVCIGENAIIGACSLVTKNVPKNEIWGGNPAKFIRIQE